MMKVNLTAGTTLSLCLLLLTVFLASCGARKQVLRTESGIDLTFDEHVAAVIDNTPEFEVFASRIKVTLPVKKGAYTLNGTLRIQKDSLIQISLLIPILRSEAARVEISPHHLLVIDRMNRRYADVQVSDLRELLHTEVDFSMLQALFTNKIFQPGRTTVTPKEFSAYTLHTLPGNQLMFVRRTNQFGYTFKTGLSTNRLLNSSIETLPSRYLLDWSYDEFTEVGNTVFPALMTVRVGKPADLRETTMELSRMEINGREIAPTAPPARYQKLGLSEVLQILENL